MRCIETVEHAVAVVKRHRDAADPFDQQHAAARGHGATAERDQLQFDRAASRCAAVWGESGALNRQGDAIDLLQRQRPSKRREQTAGSLACQSAWSKPLTTGLIAATVCRRRECGGSARHLTKVLPISARRRDEQRSYQPHGSSSPARERACG